ncbi:unnamed protein product [Caretta caretta]
MSFLCDSRMRWVLKEACCTEHLFPTLVNLNFKSNGSLTQQSGCKEATAVEECARLGPLLPSMALENMAINFFLLSSELDPVTNFHPNPFPAKGCGEASGKENPHRMH